MYSLQFILSTCIHYKANLLSTTVFIIDALLRVVATFLQQGMLICFPLVTIRTEKLSIT